MKRQTLLLLGLALAWLVACSAALAEDAPGDQPTDTPKKSKRAGKRNPQDKTAQPSTPQPAVKAPAKPPAKGPANAPAAVAKKPAQGAPSKDGQDEGEDGAVFVLPDKDAVVLRDGTRLDGTILCSGQAAVTLLTAEGEKTIPREQIERVIQSADAGVPEKFKADELDGHKYLKKDEAEEEGAAPPAKAAGPRGPAKAVPGKVRGGPPKPAAAAAPARGNPPPGPPTAPAPAALAQPPTALQPPQQDATPQPPAALPALALPKDPAQLRAYIDQLRQSGKLGALLNDPRALEALRNALK